MKWSNIFLLVLGVAVASAEEIKKKREKRTIILGSILKALIIKEAALNTALNFVNNSPLFKVPYAPIPQVRANQANTPDRVFSATISVAKQNQIDGAGSQVQMKPTKGLPQMAPAKSNPAMMSPSRQPQMMPLNSMASMVSAGGPRQMMPPSSMTPMMSANGQPQMMPPNSIASMMSATGQPQMMPPNSIASMMSATGQQQMMLSSDMEQSKPDGMGQMMNEEQPPVMSPSSASQDGQPPLIRGDSQESMMSTNGESAIATGSNQLTTTMASNMPSQGAPQADNQNIPPNQSQPQMQQASGEAQQSPASTQPIDDESNNAPANDPTQLPEAGSNPALTADQPQTTAADEQGSPPGMGSESTSQSSNVNPLSAQLSTNLESGPGIGSIQESGPSQISLLTGAEAFNNIGRNQLLGTNSFNSPTSRGFVSSANGFQSATNFHSNDYYLPPSQTLTSSFHDFETVPGHYHYQYLY